MKRNDIYLLLPAILLFLISCEKEDKLTPTEGLEPFYTLPQGDHDYDGRIMEYHEKYGIYPLYIFENKDIYWDYSDWCEYRESSWELAGDLYGVPSKPEYVNKQLDLLEECFFSRFSDLLLKRMPPKLLLCSELGSVELDYVFYDDGSYELVPTFTRKWSDKRYAQIAVNCGSEIVDNMSAEDKVAFASSVAVDFSIWMGEKNVLTPPDEFFEVSKPYYLFTKVLNGLDLFAVGLLQFDVVTATTSEAQSLKRDFDLYVTLALGNSLDKLNGPLDYWYEDGRYPTFGGVFQPEADVNGLVQQKYNIVVNYLKEIGVDMDFYQNPLK